MSHEEFTPPASQVQPSAESGTARTLPSAGSPCETPSTNQGPTFIYALGKIETRFPSIGIEKEFLQATGRTETSGLSDGQTYHHVLSKPENRYLTRQLCWVFSVEGIETYILVPRHATDYEMLTETVRPRSRPGDVDIVIGRCIGMARPEVCNGLVVPVVEFSQLYSFDIDSLIREIPRPENVQAENFETVAEELFLRISHVADNAGFLDEHRALNYLAVRYPAIYAATAAAHGRNEALFEVQVRPSRLGGTRRIVDVVFAYVHRQTDVRERYFVRVDVTEEFPFLVSPMSPY